jgi:hypothetical protein
MDQLMTLVEPTHREPAAPRATTKGGMEGIDLRRPPVQLERVSSEGDT